MGSESAPELRPVPRNTLLYSVIVPAYNEAKNLPPTLGDLAKALRAEGIPFELLVVNDNSKDDTAAVAEGMRADIPEIHLVHNTPPGGLGRAVRCGLRNFKGDVVAVVMAHLRPGEQPVAPSARLAERVRALGGPWQFLALFGVSIGGRVCWQ